MPPSHRPKKKLRVIRKNISNSAAKLSICIFNLSIKMSFRLGDDMLCGLKSVLETYLRCMTSDLPHTWRKWISLAEWWYNTTFHTTIKCTSFEIIYGHPPPLHLPYLQGEISLAVVDMSLQKMEDIIVILKFHISGLKTK